MKPVMQEMNPRGRVDALDHFDLNLGAVPFSSGLGRGNSAIKAG